MDTAAVQRRFCFGGKEESSRTLMIVSRHLDRQLLVQAAGSPSKQPQPGIAPMSPRKRRLAEQQRLWREKNSQEGREPSQVPAAAPLTRMDRAASRLSQPANASSPTPDIVQGIHAASSRLTSPNEIASRLTESLATVRPTEPPHDDMATSDGTDAALPFSILPGLLPHIRLQVMNDISLSLRDAGIRVLPSEGWAPT